MTDNKTLLLQLNQLHATLLKKVNRSLAMHGVSLTEYQVMHSLNSEEGSTMRRIDLAEQSGLSASGITRLLNPMEKIGLVEKLDHPRDARVSLVRLTKAGERTLREVDLTLGEVATRLLDSLGEAEKKTLHELMQRLQKEVG